MDLLNLEQQRQSVEASLEKLRASLKHWQTWEAEYEGLKEEIQNAKEERTTEGLEKLAKAYDGELVNEKEVRELTGVDNASPRSATQIVGLIERRQEYVQRNIESLQRQFFDTEAKAEELAFAAATQSPRSDAGLPLTEIHEELDEDGNVISSQLSQPEESTANIISSLRKAGLQEGDLGSVQSGKPKSEDLKPAITNASPPLTPATSGFEKRGTSDTALSRNSSGGAEDLERPSIRKKSVSFTADTKPPEQRQRHESEDGKKSVSFAEKVAVMPAAPPPDTRSVSFSPMVEEIPAQPSGSASPNLQAHAVQTVITPTTEAGKSFVKAVEQDEEAGAEQDAIFLPDDESPEDAETRREMLEYHLNEVGNVVAQIDLEEADDGAIDEDDEDSSSFYTTSEYPEDDDTPYTTGMSESEESEDEFGRTKRRMVSSEYRKHMEDLGQRLIGNLGPEPREEDIADADPDLDAKDVRKLVIRDKRNSTSSASSDNSEKKPGSKKRVSFAESLDVAEPGSPPLKAQKHEEGENVAPVTSDVLERNPVTSQRSSALPATSDMEVDKASIDSAGVTIANTLTERIPTFKLATAPSTDDQDSLIERRQLAGEYYRRRNEMINEQGGFSSVAADNEDDAMGTLMEERDGKLKKVSRFKAARLKS